MERNYIIFSLSEVNKIDFTEVLETSVDTLRKSVDNTLSFVKYSGSIVPNSLNSLDTIQGPYTHSEILNILEGEIWNDPNKEPLR